MNEHKVKNESDLISSTGSLLHNLKYTSELTDIPSQIGKEHKNAESEVQSQPSYADEINTTNPSELFITLESDSNWSLDQTSDFNNSASEILNDKTEDTMKNKCANEISSDNLHHEEKHVRLVGFTTDDSLSIENNTVVENEIKSEWDDVLGSGSLMKKVIKEGKPNTRPQRLQICTINYKCYLEDKTIVENFYNFELQLGDCEVVQGLDLALGLMDVGEKCLLKLEARLAFGSKGLKPLVPPNTTVYFEVELVTVDFEDDLEVLSVSQRKLKGNKKRERGNWWYGRGENQLAIQCYRRALDFLDEVEGGIKDPLPEGDIDVTDAALQELLEDRVSVCNNMAAAQIKLELHDAALQSLQTVLRCQPCNVKALYRKAKILRAKNDIPAALKCLQKANSISPNNGDIQKEISVLQNLLQKQKVSERELARRMFSTTKEQIQEVQERDSSSSKLFFWATMGVSVAAGIVGWAAYRFKLT